MAQTSTPQPMLEGRFQKYEGYLWIRTGLIIKQWKKRWFSVIPGAWRKLLLQAGRRDPFYVAHVNSCTTMSSDPLSEYFTAFHITCFDGVKCFRADDIVQMRRFMAALEARGVGLFYQRASASIEVPCNVVPPSEDELLQRQSDYQTLQIAGGVDITPQWEPPPYVRIPNIPCLFYRTDDPVSNEHTLLACARKFCHIRGECIPYKVCRDITIIKAASTRAKLKLHGFTLCASGLSGKSGAVGLTCKKRPKHEHRYCDMPCHGTHGQRGENGTDAYSVILSLSRDADELTVSGTCNFSANLRGEEVVFVNCSGGNGGRGGRGGDGNDVGMFSKGGSGGNGCDGGNAGAGGTCVLKASDPCLLMLVEADCMNGEPGTGGHGGRGGRGGALDFKTDGYFWRGTEPERAANGQNGSNGLDGLIAPCGGILWVVTSSNGDVMCESPTRYDAEVTNLTTTVLNSGIFEPNCSIAVSDILVVNSGGLTLPPGCIVSMCSTQTVRFESKTFTLPEIPPGSTFKVPITFYGRLCDQFPPKTPGPFLSSAEFHPRIELIGRPFEKSFLSKKLTVQYPIKLAFLRCPERLGQGDEATLEVGVKNISSISYGEYPGSGGTVALQIHLDTRITLVETDSMIQIDDVLVQPDAVTKLSLTTSDTVYMQFNNIPPDNTVIAKVKVHMDRLAKPFEHCRWEAYLYLHNKLIEYNFAKVDVALRYIPQNPPADILAVTDKPLTYKDLVHCQRIFNILGVTADFWDVSHHNGLSVDTQTNTRHQIIWDGRYAGRMILYLQCNLKELWPSDIVRHFHGSPNPDHEHTLEDLNSSMVLLMPCTPAKRPDGGDRNVLLHLATVGKEYESYLYNSSTLYNPDTEKRLKKRLEQLDKEFPAQSSVALYKEIKLTGPSNHRHVNVKLKRLPLLRSCKFLTVSGIGGSLIDMTDDVNFSPYTTEIPLASNFGQSILAILYGIPLRCKLNLLKTSPEQTRPLTFHLPNGYTLSKAELTAICAAREIADDVLGNSSRRMYTFTGEVLDNVSSYTANGQVILCMMELLQGELRERKKRVSNAQASQAIHEVRCQIEQVKDALLEKVTNRHDSSLPSLSILVNSSHFYWSHQYTIKDRRWNMTAMWSDE